MHATKALSTLASRGDTDSEDDLGFSVKARKTTTGTSMAVTRKSRTATAPTHKITKPAPKSSRRSSGRIAASIQKSGGRQALAEKNVNAEVNNADTGPGETSAQDATKPTGSRGRPRATKTQRRNETPMTMSDCEAKPSTAQARPNRSGPIKIAEVIEVPETQHHYAMDIDKIAAYVDDEHSQGPSDEISEVSIDPDSTTVRWTVGSAAMDTNDASLRRRLGDLARKHENLEGKYRDLRALGVKEAEKNFDRLKKQADERAQSRQIRSSNFNFYADVL
jgi:hypothetical protein